MKKNRLSALVWIGGVLLLLACVSFSGSTAADGGETAATASGSGSPASTETAEPEDTFPLPPDPITIHPVLDSGESFSNALQAHPGLAFISQIGGKTKAGVEFTLQLPEGLLALDDAGDQMPAFGSAVTVTTVSEIPDIPFGRGYLAAFQMAPEGLLMTEPASLDLTLPGEYGPEELVGFAADGAGSDFHLFPIVSYADPNNHQTIVFFSVMHFSLYGVAQATAQEIEAQQAHPPSKPDSQDEDELAPLIPQNEDDLAPLVPVTEDTKNQKKIRKSYNRTVKTYIDKLDKLDCNKVGVAAYEFQKWLGRVDGAGEVNRFQELITRDGTALLSRIRECVKINCPLCAGGDKNKKSVDLFMVLTSWGESVSKSIGDFEGSLYWRGLGDMCAQQAGIQPPHPPIAGDCTGDGCEATPTPLKCPED
jgi:hypothetical protein